MPPLEVRVVAAEEMIGHKGELLAAQPIAHVDEDGGANRAVNVDVLQLVASDFLETVGVVENGEAI